MGSDKSCEIPQEPRDGCPIYREQRQLCPTTSQLATSLKIGLLSFDTAAVTDFPRLRSSAKDPEDSALI